MKKILLTLSFLIPTLAYAAPLQPYQPGPRLIDGTQLNKMVDVVNDLSGNGVAALATGSLTASGNAAITGTLGVTGATALAGGLTLTGTTSASGLICPSYYFTGTPAATDQVFFVATRAMRIVAISQIHSVAAGGASVLQVTKDTGTDAPGAGTDLLTNNTNTGFDLSATANTVQTGTLVATAGVTTLAAGNRLAVDFANAIQSSAGVVVTACMAPL